MKHRRSRLRIEIQFSAAPKPSRGFWQALQDVQADRACDIAPAPRRYPLAQGVDVIGVDGIAPWLEGGASAGA